MIVKHLGRSGMRGAVALAVTGLMSSAPVQAVQVEQAPVIASTTEPAKPLDDMTEVVADLVDPAVTEPSFVPIAEGEASYYGRELAGNRTASGERFDPQDLTAAHRTLPMGTKLRVTNMTNGRSVLVRVNDRGPFARGRIIDISLAAAREIRMVGAGKAMVRLEKLI